MTRATLRYPARELARMRELYFPEERRSEFTQLPWDGQSFRHYRESEDRLPGALSAGTRPAGRDSEAGSKAGGLIDDYRS